MKTENFAIQLFEGKKVRIAWDAEQEKYYFAVVDIVQVLTEQPDYQLARNYWKVLKNRLVKEGNETVTNCNQLKLPAPGKNARLICFNSKVKINGTYVVVFILTESHHNDIQYD